MQRALCWYCLKNKDGSSMGIIDFMRRAYREYAVNLYRKRIERMEYLKLSPEERKLPENYKKDIQEYWGRFLKRPSYAWHALYEARNCPRDVRYIPEDIYYKYIIPKFNDLRFCYPFEDKANCDQWFSDVVRPKTIVKQVNGILFDEDYEPISYKDAISKCLCCQRYIVKPVIFSGRGSGFQLIDNAKQEDPERTIADILNKKEDFIIQEAIEQHESFSKYNPYGVCSIRITSMIFKGQVHILKSFFKVGHWGAPSSHPFQGNGGYFRGVSSDGFLQDYAICDNGKYTFTTIGNNEVAFVKEPLIAYDEIVDIIKKQHMKMPRSGLIGWDFTVDRNARPVFIEVNIWENGISELQGLNGPLFGDMTDEVLTWVFKK